MCGPESSPRPRPAANAGRTGWLTEARALDAAVDAGIAATPTPTLDRSAAALSRAADHSKLWIGVAGLLAATGARGRRSAIDGLVSIAITSGVVNLVLKPLRHRRRPDRLAHAVPLARYVEMPQSTSFPSGHAASAFAFASGVTHELPAAGVPLEAAAALVAYSRVHTGVHYPIDVVAGAVIGGALAPLATATLDRLRTDARRRGSPVWRAQSW
jgi:membrane-associated phospholipid phosphatase